MLLSTKLLSTILFLSSIVITIPIISFATIIFILSLLKVETMKLGGMNDEDNIWN